MKIVNVTYRLPITISKHENRLQVNPSSGGLATAISSLFEHQQFAKERNLWVGFADFPISDWIKVKDEVDARYDIVPIFLAREDHGYFYGGFSNSVLWPLFHYFPSYLDYQEKYFEAYKKANEIMADTLQKLIAVDDLVWIHDYHLLPLAELIRKSRPDVRIGFFLHIPFPAFELFNILPKYCREYLLKGMLGADLIGFHTHDYQYHFLRNIYLSLGKTHQLGKIIHQQRCIQTGVFPIGIDFDKFDRAPSDPAVDAECQSIRAIYSDRKIIFSVDRLDYTKGVSHRLRGYERFLEKYPQFAEKIVFLMVIVPSRADLPKYAERKHDIEQALGRINGRYGNYKWSPVVFQYHSVSFEQLAALYRCSDIALITPLRDGMNLVAKEFVAVRNDESGVLIFSEKAGAAKELPDALIINPLDKEEIADSIYTALNMQPEESQLRMQSMRKQVRHQNVFKWANDFASALMLNSKRKTLPVDTFVRHELGQAFSKSKSPLILLDYDGTLVHFQPQPSMAAPSSELKRFLSRLGHTAKVVITSGRDHQNLETWFGETGIDLISEHGAAYKKDGVWSQHFDCHPQWWTEVKSIFEDYTCFCNGSFIEEKRHGIAWHYRNVQEWVGNRSARELYFILAHFLANSNAHVINGKKVIEVKSQNVNKGYAYQNIYATAQHDCIVAIGDDTTDEDMFDAVNQSKTQRYTIKVGDGETRAEYRISSPDQVIALLEGLKKT